MGFLDVETSGLARCDEITVVGLHVEGKLHQFVAGRNIEEFLRVWRRVEVLVTFNGMAFDLPRILRAFGLTSVPPHLDLRSEAQAHGLVGGLKQIEKTMGFVREDFEDGNGSLASEWWAQYVQHHDADALDRLLRYNARDTLALIDLIEHLWHRSMEGFPSPLVRPAQTTAVVAASSTL